MKSIYKILLVLVSFCSGSVFAQGTFNIEGVADFKNANSGRIIANGNSVGVYFAYMKTR